MLHIKYYQVVIVDCHLANWLLGELLVNRFDALELLVPVFCPDCGSRYALSILTLGK